MSSARRRVLASGLAAALALAPAVFAVVRVVQERLGPEPDPAVVIYADQSFLQTRWIVTAFVVAVVALGTIGLAGRVRSMHRWIVGGALLSVCVTVLQAWRVP